jgi:DNA-binding winged helix-turn-helix (wHTH) protein
VNVVPIANQSQDHEEKRDQKQSRRFGRVDRVAVMLVIVLGAGFGHADIVAPRERASLLSLETRNAPRKTFLLHYGVVPQRSSRVARFGLFELDLSAGELRRSGVKLRLQGQPFQVLAVLLERAGDVVTREELQQKLWPSDTFVDFDHSLNTAINKVREALGDSASSPRFVETLARRGYRFIAPVQTDAMKDALPAGDAAVAAGDRVALTSSASSDGHSPTVAMHPDLEVPIPRRTITRGLFALIQVMYLAFYLTALIRLHQVQAVADLFLPLWGANLLSVAVMVTAGVGIPLRCYLLSAVGFDYQRLGDKFRQIFPFVLALDQLWAVAPFLLIQEIGLGAAFAVSAALLYLPFSERTLIRMAYLSPRTANLDSTI